MIEVTHIFSHLTLLTFTFISLKGRFREGGRNREKWIFHSLVYSPNACNGQGQYPGTFMQVSGTAHKVPGDLPLLSQVFSRELTGRQSTEDGTGAGRVSAHSGGLACSPTLCLYTRDILCLAENLKLQKSFVCQINSFLLKRFLVFCLVYVLIFYHF